jgi:hypothetical protein
MKKTMLASVLSLITFTSSYGQLDPIDVADLTLKISGTGDEELYYGFAEGDQMIFSFEEINGKELKEIEIIELPSNSKFMDYKSVKIDNKKISVNKRSVYLFKFKNSAISGRICKVKIQRIPKTVDQITFNTNWEWKTLYDTTYVAYTQDSLVGYDTLKYKENVKELITTESIDEMILDKTQKVHSYMNDNSSYTYLRVDLPQNRKETYIEEVVTAWAYWIGVGEESSQAYAQNIKTVGKIASGVASVYGTPLAGVAVGAVTELLTPKSGEDVTYAFIADFQNVQAFLAGQAYYQFDKGKGIAAYGKNTNRLQGTFYIGLHNDNDWYGIDVNVKIVVIKQIKTYEDVEYDREKIEPKYVKLNKQRMVINKRQIRVNAN